MCLRVQGADSAGQGMLLLASRSFIWKCSLDAKPASCGSASKPYSTTVESRLCRLVHSWFIRTCIFCR